MRRSLVRAECSEATSARSASPRGCPPRQPRPHSHAGTCSPAEASTKPRATQTPSRRAGMRSLAGHRIFPRASFVGVTPAGDDGERDESRLDTKRVPANDSPRRRADCRARAESDVPRPSASPHDPRTERRPSQQTLAMSSQTFQAARATQARASPRARARRARFRAAVISKAKPADAAESDEHAAARLGRGAASLARRRWRWRAPRREPALGEELLRGGSVRPGFRGERVEGVLRRRRGVGERAEHHLARGQEGGEGGEGGGGGAKLRAAMEESAAREAALAANKQSKAEAYSASVERQKAEQARKDAEYEAIAERTRREDEQDPRGARAEEKARQAASVEEQAASPRPSRRLVRRGARRARRPTSRRSSRRRTEGGSPYSWGGGSARAGRSRAKKAGVLELAKKAREQAKRAMPRDRPVEQLAVARAEAAQVVLGDKQTREIAPVLARPRFCSARAARARRRGAREGGGRFAAG